MSNSVYPGAIDSIYDPQTTDTLASADHHLLHGTVNDAVIALETKLGTGSSTPSTSGVAPAFLVASGAGASTWTASPTSPSFTTSILDTNGKTWLGQTATTSAVNYVNIANAATTNAPAISAAGSDTNINLNLVPKGSGKTQDNGSNLIDFRSSFNNFVSTGCVWTAGSGLVGSMTAGTLWINGVEYTVGVVSSHTFGASVDTYVDYTAGTGLVYTAVSNGAASPSLASNSIRLAKVVTGASSISSVTQIGGDTLGNLFAPPGAVYTSKISNPYKFSYYRNSAFSVTSTSTLLTYDTKTFDSGANYSTSTGLFTAPVAGFYFFDAAYAMTSGSSIYQNITLYKNTSTLIALNGSQEIGATQSNSSVLISKFVQLAINDTIQVQIAAGGTITGNTGINNTWFEGFLVSAD